MKEGVPTIATAGAASTTGTMAGVARLEVSAFKPTVVGVVNGVVDPVVVGSVATIDVTGLIGKIEIGATETVVDVVKGATNVEVVVGGLGTLMPTTTSDPPPSVRIIWSKKVWCPAATSAGISTESIFISPLELACPDVITTGLE